MDGLSIDDLEQAPCGFVVFADTGIITAINDTLLHLLAIEFKDDVIGRSIETVMTISSRIFYQTHFFPLLKLHGKANEIFMTLRTRDGADIPVICNAVMREQDGMYRCHCVFILAAERKKYEQELLNARRQAEEALEKNHDLMAAKEALEEQAILLDKQISHSYQVNNDIALFSKIISHDLQEPVRKISLFADRVLVEAGHLIPRVNVEELGKIKIESLRLRTLAANLEKYISLNLKTESFTHLNLSEIVRRAYYKALNINDDMPVTFSMDKLPEIDGYEGQLVLLFYNVFENSLKYREAGTPLKLSVKYITVQQNSFRKTTGKYRYIDFVKITVTDDGNGFENTHSDQLFELTRKASSKNIGFGLAFCKKIADNHYGDIAVASIPGKGTTVTISLPVEQGMS